MTKADFIAAVFPAYIKTRGTSANSDDHALWASNLVEKLENAGIEFSEDSTNTKQNTIIQDVE